MSLVSLYLSFPSFFVELKLIFAFFVRLGDLGFDLFCVLSLIMALNVLILEERWLPF